MNLQEQFEKIETERLEKVARLTTSFGEVVFKQLNKSILAELEKRDFRITAVHCEVTKDRLVVCQFVYVTAGRGGISSKLVKPLTGNIEAEMVEYLNEALRQHLKGGS
jgi:hypothetical protein